MVPIPANFDISELMLKTIDALSTWGWHNYQGKELLDTNFLEDGDEPGHGIRAALAALGLPNTVSRDAATGLEVFRLDHFTNPEEMKVDEQTYENFDTGRLHLR